MMRFSGLFSFALCVALLVSNADAATKNPLGGKRDNHKPIEVTSDELQVYQEENRAVFSGHVIAIQGDIRLKSDTMTVFYRKSAEKAEANDKSSKDDKAAGKDAIRKIDAAGNVFLSTPEETASGAKGTYDVEHHEIHLIDKVVLTRGQNVLKGNELTYNLDTGKSVLSGETTAAQTPDEKTPGGKQRVRALFVPGKDTQLLPK